MTQSFTLKRKPRRKYFPMTDSALRRFVFAANRLYFEGKLDIFLVSFRRLDGFLGRTEFHTFCVYRQEDKRSFTQVERAHIIINERLRPYRDLCKMTVYHELVHAELTLLGFIGKENSCRKSSDRFNQRMAKLAAAGAFNGFW